MEKGDKKAREKNKKNKVNSNFIIFLLKLPQNSMKIKKIRLPAYTHTCTRDQTFLSEKIEFFTIFLYVKKEDIASSKFNIKNFVSFLLD